MRGLNIRHRIIWLVSISVFILFVIFLGIVIKYWSDYKNIPSHHLIGNRVSNVNLLREEGFPFSFLVMGDLEGSRVSEELLRKALKGKAPSFLILLGDFVRNPDIWNHRFFIIEMTKELKLSLPVFLVAGNHDIDYASKKIKEDKRRVTVEVFESLYGQMNFDFTFNKCLFIFLGVDMSRPSLFLNYLRDTLSQKGEGKRYIFVFIHYPPNGLVDYVKSPFPTPEEEEFLSLLEKYKVTTCFFGDYHGYWRGQRKGTNFIISGGGGGRLKKSQPEWGRFYHILRISVSENQISEEMITLGKESHLEDSFEREVFTKIFPIIHGRVWVIYFLFSLFLFLSIYSIIISVRNLWKKNFKREGI